jgi:hypothetical protein
MARRRHQATYVVNGPFTNTLVFVMTDCMKSVNAFLERIPKELQEQYFTDYITELEKLVKGEANNINDGGILFKSKIIVAFARKTRKLRPLI